MPGAPGDPVRFANPFRRLTGVGWPTPYYAFQIKITEEAYDATAEPCSAPVGMDDPNHPAHYMTECSMRLKIGQVLRLSGKTWKSIDGETLANDPSRNVAHTFAPKTVSVIYADEPFRFAELSGDPIEDNVPVPDRPEAKFLETLDLSYEVLSRTIDGSSPVCLQGYNGSWLHYPYTSEIQSVIAPEPIAVGDMVLHHKGKAYTPIGLFLVPHIKGANPTNYISAPVTAWVLCKRSESADPST